MCFFVGDNFYVLLLFIFLLDLKFLFYFLFQFVEFLFELDDDDEDFCKVVVEFEEGGIGNVYFLDGVLSFENWEFLDVNNGVNKIFGDLGRKRRFM